ncbi:MAG: hypothetical protein ACUVWA_15350 [Candidatus Oleimicrobiaceae bacterium]
MCRDPDSGQVVAQKQEVLLGAAVACVKLVDRHNDPIFRGANHPTARAAYDLELRYSESGLGSYRYATI